jgi:hypothetical protein
VTGENAGEANSDGDPRTSLAAVDSSQARKCTRYFPPQLGAVSGSVRFQLQLPLAPRIDTTSTTGFAGVSSVSDGNLARISATSRIGLPVMTTRSPAFGGSIERRAR